jgi:hypothetical protein
MTTTINASTTAGLVQTADTSGVLALQTAGTTAVTVDASQNVTLAGKLGVTKRATFAAPASFDAISASTGTVEAHTSYGNAIAGNGSSYDLMILNRNGQEAFGVVANTQNVVAAGTLKGALTISVGNATPSTSGAGITFPATQSASSDANTLDDYEEGTWTPTVTFGGGSATVASSAAYIKIGKTCFVNGYVSFSSVSSASSGSITNFPFTAASISGSPRQVLVAREDAATGKMGQVYISAGSTTAALQDYVGANAGTVFANGYTWIFTGTYNTSA